MVSGTRPLAEDPLTPLSCWVGPPQHRFVLAHSMDAQSDWDLRKSEAESTPQSLINSLCLHHCVWGCILDHVNIE